MIVVGFGEGAALVDLEIDGAPDRAARTNAVASAIRARSASLDVVVGAGTVLVVGADRAAIEALARSGELDRAAPPDEGRLHVIAAAYDGPDLAAAAGAAGLGVEALIAAHSERTYTVELLGFLPGFAYAGPLDPALVLARRASPRAVVPAKSIGIAGTFTGIYPFASPGGWNLIARALDAELFDAHRAAPCLFAPGDRIRFEPSTDRGFQGDARRPGAQEERSPARGPRLVVTAAHAVATIQDGGRRGLLARGLPPSGALDRATLAAANRAVGNPEGAAAIEVPLGRLVVRVEKDVLVSIDGAPAQRFTDGASIELPASERAVRYLAARGGIDVPCVLGARSTLLVARTGGFEGRPLRRGDVIPIGPEDACDDPAPTPPSDDSDTPLELDPGPHLARFPSDALAALLTSAWRVSTLADRVGVRLEGGRVPRDRPDLALPVPMRRGAVQVSTDGTPIVLGPDHPTTGGYPVLAILRRDAQDRLARKRPGDQVRFRLGG